MKFFHLKELLIITRVLYLLPLLSPPISNIGCSHENYILQSPPKLHGKAIVQGANELRFWYQQKNWSLLVECTWRLFRSLHGKKTTKNCDPKIYISFFQSLNVKVVFYFHAHETNHTLSWKHTWALNLLPWSWSLNKRKIDDQTSFTTKISAKTSLTPYYFCNYNHHPLLLISSSNMPKINHVHP
jgi:hypothetical protein